MTQAGFALRTALIVSARRERMFHHRVANNQFHCVRHRQQLKFERAAIEPQRSLCLPQQRSKLVHDTDTRADKLVLYLLTEQGKLAFVYTKIGVRSERARSCYLPRRLRTQARADRNFTTNVQLRAVQAMSRAFEHHRNTDCVIAPVMAWRRIRIVEIKFYVVVEVF